MSVDQQVTVVHNPEANRFEIVLDGNLAKADYHLEDGRIIFTHTEVPAALEGRGLGGKLAQAGLDYSREQGLRVVPRCPFISSYIKRHQEYNDLVDHAG